MAAKIGIIGKGNVGGALQRGLARAGHDVRAVGKDPEAVRQTAEWAEVVFLAVPFGAVDETLRELGEAVNGKVLVDTTNALTPDMQLALGYTTSGAEELQKKAARATVVKAFNTVFSKHMDTGQVKGEKLSLFVASDDASAKERVLGLGRDIGFDAIDAGPLRNARWLESLAYLNIQLGYVQKLGRDIGFRLVR
ncbi:NADPH-dependent F420 reductase [Hyalangium rubrum]|uniref:NADPH-dependent F420 reductase n=1 Tax=Hyalangium rubrum TaxID=3103134 RepID=A0ABU5HEH9_9BACT|nr:NADPH-dependent F420 reductase [Hyalangium sp. s54d21]MDY7231208.1 NADPH-dependent F420 reductase [Hyalangium sp. s54d21]